jgi:hypothetical protein
MPPAAPPIREQIERAVAARLVTIVEGPDYFFTITPERLTREMLDLEHFKYQALLREGPILGVMRGSGSTFDPDYSQTSESHAHRFALWGYVYSGIEDDPVNDLLNRLWQDATKCLLLDRTLAGLAKMLLTPDGPMDTDDGAKEPYGVFRQHWVAHT